MYPIVRRNWKSKLPLNRPGIPAVAPNVTLVPLSVGIGADIVVVGFVEAVAVAAPLATLPDSGAGFGFVCTSVTTGVISVFLAFFEISLRADWFHWLLALRVAAGSSQVLRSLR